MKDKDIVDLAVMGFVALVVVPAVVGITFSAMGHIAVGVGNVINKVKFNKKIKKGLKDGSIIELDGKFYEVETDGEMDGVLIGEA